MGRIRLGVLGAGNFANKHLCAIEALGDKVELAAVARRSDAPWPQAEAAGARRLSPESLVADPEVDAVAVCLPNGLHRPWVEAALRAGKHVFCEKPLALTLEDADVLIALAEETGRTLLVGHLTRHTAAYAAVAEVLEAGRLGELRTLYSSRLQLKTAATGWRLDPALGGGALFDLLIHDFDLLGWYLGPPERVQACGLRNDTGVREYVAAAFTYPGIVAVVEGGFILPDTERFRSTLRICGTAGCLELDPATFPGLRLVLDGHSPQTVALGPYESTHRGIIGEYEEFLARIAGNPPQRLRLDDARRAIEYATLTAQAIQA